MGRRRAGSRAPAREEVANRLAGRLLLPTAWFLADAASGGWDLLALKSQYATASHELIARRMLECPPPVIVTIFDHRAVSFRRSNVPGQVPPPSAAEMACWRHGPRRRLPAADRRRPADGARLAGPRARLEAGDPAGGSGRVKERGRAEGGRGKAEQRVIFSRSAAADRLRFRTDPCPSPALLHPAIAAVIMEARSARETSPRRPRHEKVATSSGLWIIGRYRHLGARHAWPRHAGV